MKFFLLLAALIVVGCSATEPGIPAYPEIGGQSARPNVLIFRSDSCPHCLSLAEIEVLKGKYKAADFQAVDIHGDTAIATKYGVTRVPFYIVCFHDSCWTTVSLDELKGWLVAYQSP